jgi:hypothetical protein
MNEMLVGAIAMAWLISGLFFLRFWKTTRDRFFLFFATAFFIEGFNRILFWQTAMIAEELEAYYLIRLVAYALILVAILDKNRGRNK